MTAKQVLFESEAREKILHGAERLADAVRITLGPKSKSVVIQKRVGAPVVCNDGVTIAKEMEFEDPEEKLGAQILRQAAELTGDAIGDGTSTSTVLAHAILTEGVRRISAGASAVDLKRGLERGLGVAKEALKSLARPVRTRQEKAQVATISAHNDPAIGELVADALERLGSDGAITVEESKASEASLEIVEGMRFNRGYISPHFVADTARVEMVLEDTLVFVTERKLNLIKDLTPLLDVVAKSGRPILFIADEIQGEALATLTGNHNRGMLTTCAVRAPDMGDQRKAMLQDIAIFTGAQLFSEDAGAALEHVRLGQLGRARRAIVDENSTTLIGGGGDPASIAGRVVQLRTEIQRATSDFEREKLQKRLTQLSGNVAVLRAGATFEGEMKARREALNDAIGSTKAAIAEGIVPGGGLALIKLADALAAEERATGGDERMGFSILRRALEAPARQIAENSAADGGVAIDRVRAAGGNIGFDAATQRYVDLFEAGIVDPAKVVRIALENAVAAAGILLLTDAAMTEKARKVDNTEKRDPEL